MGAGYSGLMMAIVFSEQMKNKNAELVIYERNEDLGGTWLENRLVNEVIRSKKKPLTMALES
jgi:cation diffusion facilitator CzcD-associated flavoprotein CzcO